MHWFWLLWHFFTHRWTRYAFSWLFLLGLAAGEMYFARTIWNNKDPDPAKQRPDSNDGHTSIDFGGQWLMGRMLTRGYGHELYNRNRQYEVALQAYPRENEAPAADGHDAENLLNWFMDEATTPQAHDASVRINRTRASTTLPLAATDPFQAAAIVIAASDENWTAIGGGEVRDQQLPGPWTSQRIDEVSQKRVGGPLYPPTQAFLFALLATSDHPQWAYFTMQWLLLGVTFFCGLGVSFLTHRRIWWPVATAILLLYPGLRGALHLGQNAPLSLAVVIWGWLLISRGYQYWGGVVWGLMVFKPTWAAAFFLVPLFSWRWRTCIAMAATGVCIALATVPFVGVHSWLDWLKVGKAATLLFEFDQNWIFLSRDLLGIPRRFLVNFDEDEYTRDHWYIQLAGWCLWVFVVEVTLRISLLCHRQLRTDTRAATAFLLLGAWMSCFHFMYYDVLLSSLAVFVLLSEPKRFVEPLLATFQRSGEALPLDAFSTDYFGPRMAKTHPELTDSPNAARRTWVANSFLLYFVLLLIIIQHLFPWLDVKATFEAGRLPLQAKTTNVDGQTSFVVTNGKTEFRPKQLSLTTSGYGPAWDTFALMGLWLWCGVRMLRQYGREQRGTPLAEFKRAP
ncbi:MAG TPA: glycosyltransferase family 87 protein [Gemmataceae bacterium]|nr:glycosyltransferase family 87 protein [Gemmataceae bacterium]